MSVVYPFSLGAILRGNLALFSSFGRTLFTVFLAGLICFGCLSARLSAQENQGSSAVETVKFSSAEVPPVKRIIFYSTGIAQVIHEGTVDGNQQVSLSFDDSKIDDVLKSLVVDDRDGGSIKSVEYHPAPNQEDIAAKQFAAPMTVAQILQSYRGDKLTVSFPDNKKSGSIVGVENRQVGSDSVESVTLLTENGLKTFAINDARSISFDDEDIREKFKLAMTGLSNSRDVAVEKIDLFFSGEGTRNVRFAYVIDSPIWKMTYRLDLSNEDESKLQGWAHIDNITGLDWEGVTIELRNGRADSFHADLFSPLVGKRRSAGISAFGIANNTRVVRPWSFGSDPQNDVGWNSMTGGKGLGGRGGGGFGGGGGLGGSGGGFGGGATGETEPEPARPFAIGITPVAAMSRAAMMVKFEIESPVNLSAGSSAMLPVIVQDIPVTKLTMFDSFNSGSTPQLVAQIENKTALPFVPGPLTVYQSGDFVGDAKMPRVELNDFVELKYGVDQPVSLKNETKPEETKIVSASFKGDKILLTSLVRHQSVNTIENKDSDPREILIKQWNDDSVSKPAPSKVEGNLSHYRYTVAANENSINTLTWTRTKQLTMSYNQLPEGALDTWTAGGTEISDDLKTWLTQSDKINSRRKGLESDMYILEGKFSKATREQQRLLKILAALETKDESREKYVTKLADFENTIEALTPELEAKKKAVRAVQAELKSHKSQFGDADHVLENEGNPFG